MTISTSVSVIVDVDVLKTTQSPDYHQLHDKAVYLNKLIKIQNYKLKVNKMLSILRFIKVTHDENNSLTSFKQSALYICLIFIFCLVS